MSTNLTKEPISQEEKVQDDDFFHEQEITPTNVLSSPNRELPSINSPAILPIFSVEDNNLPPEGPGTGIIANMVYENNVVTSHGIKDILTVDISIALPNGDTTYKSERFYRSNSATSRFMQFINKASLFLGNREVDLNLLVGANVNFDIVHTYVEAKQTTYANIQNLNFITLLSK